MAVKMAQNIQEERLRWILPIVNKEIKLVDASKVCLYGKRTLERWLALYKKGGKAALLSKSTRPKNSSNKTDKEIEEMVVRIRKRTRLCALKIKWKLDKKGIHMHERTIGEIIKRNGLTRRYRKRKIKYKYIKTTLLPGEVVEIDIKYVPYSVENRRYFQYTAIDCASRWRYLKIYDNQTNHHSVEFLKEVIEKFSYGIKAVKTDNGSVFTNFYLGSKKRSDGTQKDLHALDKFCRDNGIIHYLIDPGKPAQNGKVERSHRSDQASLYDRAKALSYMELERLVKRWNKYYNNLEHCGLSGKTPNEFLAEYQR